MKSSVLSLLGFNEGWCLMKSIFYRKFLSPESACTEVAA